MDKKNLILILAVFSVLVMCSAVFATGNVNSSKTLSSTNLGHSKYPKLIDAGVTLTKGYGVKKNSAGHYSIGIADKIYPGMSKPTKYYWKTYLLQNGTIVIHTHFYHTTLKKEIYQTIVIGKYPTKNGKIVYHTVSPKSWGASSYWTLDGLWNDPLQFYWNSSEGYPSFREKMIKNAPEGAE
jgi:hypothetical protein